MGGKSGGGKQEVNEYQLSQHIGFCYTVDFITKLFYGEKVMWQGVKILQGSVGINKPNLHGGPKKEGGVVGNVEFLPGHANQVLPNKLAQKLGRDSGLDAPGFRGLTSLFFTGNPNGGFTWQANTPYLKPVWMTAIRAPKGPGLNESISLMYEDFPEEEIIPVDEVWRYKDGLLAEDGANPPLAELIVDPSFDDSSWLTGRQPFANATHPFPGNFPSTPNTVIPLQRSLWLRKTGIVLTPGFSLEMTIFVDNEVMMYWNGAPVVRVKSQGGSTEIFRQVFEPFTMVVESDWSVKITIPGDAALESNTIAAFFQDDVQTSESSDFFAAGIALRQTGAALEKVRADANPAHIVYECMTNTDFGLGDSPDLFDIASFNAAAQTCWDEKLMLSMQWTRQTSVEDFNNEVLKHMNAVVFTNPRNGLHTLRLVRGGYNEADLRQLNEYNCKITKFSRRVWGQTVNEITVTWTNPETEKEETVTVQDLGNISVQGKIVPSSRNYYGVRSRQLAQELAYRELRVAAASLCTAEVELDRTAWDILPADVVALTYPEFGIVGMPMRVGTVDYGNIGSSNIRVTLTEDVFALPVSRFEVAPPPPVEQGGQLPAPVFARQFFTLPAYATAALSPDGLAALPYPSAFQAVAAQAPNVDAQSFELFAQRAVPNGDLTWESRGTLNFTSKALLSQALLAESETVGEFFNSIVGEGPTVSGFMLIGNGPEEECEFALIQSYESGLGYTFKRGVFDTVPRAWAAETRVWFITIDSFAYDPVVSSDGQTPEYKLLTNTSKGQLALSTAPIYEGRVTDRPHLPLRPANVKVGDVGFGQINIGNASSVLVSWNTRNRLTEESIILDWSAASTPPEAGQTTTVVVMDIENNVIGTTPNLEGNEFVLPLSGFDQDQLRVAVWSERNGMRSLQGHVINLIRVSSGGGGSGYTKEDLNVPQGAAKWAMVIGDSVYAFKHASLKKQDIDTLSTEATRTISTNVTGLATDGLSVFSVDIGNPSGGLSGRLKKHSLDLENVSEVSFPLYGDGMGVTFFDGSVWVTLPYSGLVRRYDPVTLAVQADISVSMEVRRLTNDGTHVYVSDAITKKIYKIDPVTNTIVLTIDTAEQARTETEIAVSNGLIFIGGVNTVDAYDIATGGRNDDMPLMSGHVVNAVGNFVAVQNGIIVQVINSASLEIVGNFQIPLPPAPQGNPYITLIGDTKLIIDDTMYVDYYTYVAENNDIPILLPLVYADGVPIAFASSGPVGQKESDIYESTNGGSSFQMLNETTDAPISTNPDFVATLNNGKYISVDSVSMHTQSSVSEFFLTVGQAGSPPSISTTSFTRPNLPAAIGSDGTKFYIVLEGNEVFETTDGITLTSIGEIEGLPQPLQSSFVHTGGNNYSWASNYGDSCFLLKRAGRWFLSYAGEMYYTDAATPVGAFTKVSFPIVSGAQSFIMTSNIVEYGGKLFAMGAYFPSGGTANVNVVFVSTNNGASWSVAMDNAAVARDVYEIGGVLIAIGYLLVTQSNISTDGGTTWTKANNNLAPFGGIIGYPLFAGDKIIYSVLNADAPSDSFKEKLRYTTDGINGVDISLTAEQAPDPLWNDVWVLNHFDTEFPVASAKGLTFVSPNVTTTETAAAKFGGRGIRFPSAGTRGVRTNTASSPNFGAADFTIELLIKPAVLSGNKHIYNQFGPVYPSGPAITLDGSKIKLSWPDSNSHYVTAISADGAIVTNVYQHIALVRRSGTFEIFVDGVSVLTESAHFAIPIFFDTGTNNSVWLGSDIAGSNGFIGDMDELRITMGHARYTGPFTPPTQAFPHGTP